MRDFFAAVAALVLLAAAASLATTLQAYRRRRVRARDSERALGRTIIAEIPAGDDLFLFSEDASRFYYGEQSIDKDLIVAARCSSTARRSRRTCRPGIRKGPAGSRPASMIGRKASRAIAGTSHSRR